MKGNPVAMAVWLVAGCAGSVPPGGSRSPAPIEAAPIVQLDRTTLLISFPAQAGADLTWPAQRLPEGYAGPEWRVLIHAGDEWILVASLQLVPNSTQLLGPYGSTSDALEHARFRECSLGQHTISCSKSLNGDAAIEGKELVLRIKDRSLITRLQANRHLHPSARLNFRRNQQDIVWQGTVYLDYR
jgi:hypothetical protein